MKNFRLLLIICVILFSYLIPQSPDANKYNVPGKEYFTDDFGNILMYVNIIGHVKKPGTYLVHEETDLFTVLSQAGGPLPGAKLKKAFLYREGSNIQILDLESFLKTGNSNIIFKPNDTIYIEETLFSFLLSKGNILNSALQMLNIYISIKN